MTPAEEIARRPASPGFVEFVALTAALMALTALSIDMMIPALDLIRADLAVAGENDQQLVVTVYFAGFAIGQIFQGPLSDRFGRRPVLFVGLAAFALASFAAAGAGSLAALLTARFLQGAANSAPRVVAVAVIRDLYGGRRMAEVMSFVMMVFILVPVLAPSFGSLVLLVGDWRVIFLLLGAAAIAVLIWAGLRLPETRPAEQREPLSAAWLWGAGRETLTTRTTLGYMLATGFLFGAVLAYVSSAQQVFVGVFATGAWFPVIFGLVAAGIAAASLLNSQLVGRVGMRRVSHAALLGFLAASAALALVSSGAEAPPLPLFLAFLLAAFFCFGLMMPNFTALAMEPMGRIAGTASSVIGATTTAIAAFVGGYIGQHFDGTVGPLTRGFAACAVVALVIVLVTERGQLFRKGL